MASGYRPRRSRRVRSLGEAALFAQPLRVFGVYMTPGGLEAPCLGVVYREVVDAACGWPFGSRLDVLSFIEYERVGRTCGPKRVERRGGMRSARIPLVRGL